MRRLISASRIEGKIFTGGTHLDALRQWVITHRLPPFLREHEDRWEQAMNWLDTHIKEWPEQEDGFLDIGNQEFLGREEALNVLGARAQAQARDERRTWADSSDLDLELDPKHEPAPIC
jgi:hypothetical protein